MILLTININHNNEDSMQNNIQDIYKPLFEAIVNNFGKVSDELKIQREQFNKLIAS